MTVMETHYRGQQPAHGDVLLRDADKLFRDTGIDWPVSGDETFVSYGRLGTRMIARTVNVWDMTGGEATHAHVPLQNQV